MAKPTTLADWATDLNYPADANPEASSATKVPLSLDQATIGWRPGRRPPAQELNTWQNNVGQWVRWFESQQNDGDIILGPFAGMVKTNWAPHLDGYMLSSGAGSYVVGLPLIQGGRLRRFSFGVRGDMVANVTITLNRNVAGGNSTLATKLLTAPTAAFTEYRFDHFARVEAPDVIEIDAFSGTITFDQADPIDLGFWVGMEVAMTGFVNGGNNVTKRIANVGGGGGPGTGGSLIFVDSVGLVDETGDGVAQACTVVCPNLTAANTSLWLEFAADAAAIEILDVRYARDDGSLIVL